MAFVQFPNPTPFFPILPPLAWSVHKKPILASRATTAITGRSTQVACAVFPRWAFTLSYGGGSSWLRDQTQNITPDPTLAGFTELEQISGLFLACLGPYGEFYYTDPDDNSRLANVVGSGNGVQTKFPLFYQWGTGPFLPPMYIPVGGINTLDAIYFNGVVQNPNIYSLGADNVSVVFNVAPPLAQNITADFSFYFRCRFLDDQITFAQWARNLWDTKEVRFESVKP